MQIYYSVTIDQDPPTVFSDLGFAILAITGEMETFTNKQYWFEYDDFGMKWSSEEHTILLQVIEA